METKINKSGMFSLLKKQLNKFTVTQIENGIEAYCLNEYGCDGAEFIDKNTIQVVEILASKNLPTDLETIVEFFESLLVEENKDENGIIFTPKYIADYIVSNTLHTCNKWNPKISIIDPGCGCGIFLISAAEYLHNRFNIGIDDIINNNIYGIELDADNARRCKIVMKLLSAKYSGHSEDIEANILCADSLKCDWAHSFDLMSFDYIIGNPPYVNPHDMNVDTVKFLKNNFLTTQSGVYNIFYAFIEHAMKFLDTKGTLGYIVPNNFLTIKSALDLREYLQSQRYVKKILDFGDNMVFRPVRTYNCILQLTKKRNKSFEYYVIPKVDDIEKSLASIQFNPILIDDLDKNGWKLVDEKTRRNLSKIESQMMSIKEFIRTGIATLRDAVYLVEHDENGYFKIFDGEKIYIEEGLVKPIYKIPELKLYDNIEKAKRFIIFPYIKSELGYTLIPEYEFEALYPKTHMYLCNERKTLDLRDKGKGMFENWYAYGRTQGLNKYGKKLLFPTFAKNPKFTYVDNEDALFCNGYAVFENSYYDLDILSKILNSRLMDYYVRNTSYSIEGGYFCYQKKYIERFSLPWFTEDILTFIRKAKKDELDEYLWKLYDLE